MLDRQDSRVASWGSAGQLSCCASMGSPYGFGGVTTYYERLASHPGGWTDEELQAMVRRIKAGGFGEVIPWVDFPPGAICESGSGREILSVRDAGESFRDRLRRFTQMAHEEGIRVQFYFEVGPPVMAARRLHEDGKKRLHVNELGLCQPHHATRDRQNRSSLDLARTGDVEMAFAGLGFPEVQDWLADMVVNTVVEAGADGIQLEPVATPLDAGTCVYGYDAPTVSEFERRHGRDARVLANDDEQWVAHRCALTTELVRKVRERIARQGSVIELSCQCLSDKTDKYQHFWPWTEWTDQGLVDAVYLKKGSEQGLCEDLREIKTRCDRRKVRCIGILDIKSYNICFSTPESIAAGVRAMQKVGLDVMGIYGLAFTPLAPNPKEAPVERWLTTCNLLKNPF